MRVKTSIIQFTPIKLTLALILGLTLLPTGNLSSYAQSNGTVRGSILDPSGAVIANATVQIQNAVAHYDRTVQSSAEGKFVFNNVPYNNYHLSASASGFQTSAQDVDVRAAIPADLKVEMKVGGTTTEVEVLGAR